MRARGRLTEPRARAAGQIGAEKRLASPTQSGPFAIAAAGEQAGDRNAVIGSDVQETAIYGEDLFGALDQAAEAVEVPFEHLGLAGKA